MKKSRDFESILEWPISDMDMNGNKAWQYFIGLYPEFITYCHDNYDRIADTILNDYMENTE